MNQRWITISCSLLLITAASLLAADWPTYRHDGQRSGATGEEIDAATLGRVWVWESAVPPAPAWHGPAKWNANGPADKLADTRDYDKAFQISVSGGLLYVASSGDDSVHGVDRLTGKDRWVFTTDGPVRIAPEIHAGNAYFRSDDGYAYCVDATTGALVWKFSPVPDVKRIFNNGRLISPRP